MIVADTGAIVALIDADDAHHLAVRRCYEDVARAWVLPSVILPEVDYLVATHVGTRAHRAWLKDLATGAFAVEYGDARDVVRAAALCAKHASLELGLVDAVVMAIAERVRATAIATLDVRAFGAVKIIGAPKLIPRDA